jgi:hypothetical protein
MNVALLMLVLWFAGLALFCAWQGDNKYTLRYQTGEDQQHRSYYLFALMFALLAVAAAMVGLSRLLLRMAVILGAT